MSSIDALDRSNCVYVEIQCVDLEVKKQQQLEPKNQSSSHLNPTKVLFQIDSEVEQVDPNRNQMEQSKGLEVIKSRDMEVGLSRSQPWKWNPIKPVKAVKSWFH